VDNYIKKGDNVFKTADRTELNQISLTGIRSIVLAGLLIMAPRSLDEIRKAFVDLQIMEDDNSDDILRIDLNTLKHMGCEISRSSAKTNFKYVLGKHPFSFTMTENELKALKKAYSKIAESASLQLLISYDELFKKISAYVSDPEAKEAFLGISALRHFDSQEIKELLLDCSNQRTIELLYQKPASKNPEKKEIVAQNLVFQNEKMYLYGYDLEKQESVVLNYKRIKSILSRKLKQDGIEVKSVQVKFTLDGVLNKRLQANEKVVEKNGKTLTVVGDYHNEFLAIQRILSFGSKCKVIEPVEFKNVIISKLKEMRKNYE
jgi:predicted DNA-binding transcriptional regulator YafY